MISPTLRQLRYLIALHEQKSFSKAAAQCLVTQSTLSAGIKDLETILGQPLVNRSKRGVSLTPYGAQILPKAQDALKIMDDLMAHSRELSAPLSGPLRLGVIPTIAPYILPALLPKLKKEYPLLEIQLFEDLSDRLVDRLSTGQIDVALMAFPFNTPGMTQKILFEEPFLLARLKSNTVKRSRKTALKIEDLENEDLLLLEDGHCLRDHALSACKLAPPRSRATFSASSLATLIQMVQHGYGATLLPEMVVSEAQLSSSIETIPFATPKPTRQIGLVWQNKHSKQEDFDLLAKTITQLQKPSKKSIKRAR